MSAAQSASGLGVRGLTKRFGDRTVLRDVSFSVAPGEIVALLGENGAGKTTLLRLVSGFLDPDGGSVTENGRDVRLRGPRDGAALGVGMVHQHFLLIPELTVTENVVLGQEPGKGPWLDRAAAREQVRACAAKFRLEVDPDARVGDLGVAAKQRVELLKVLVRGARYLLLDEPTGLLPPAGVRELFELVERLAAEGCGVVLVTHRLPEVFAVCSRATVLRHGEVTGTRLTAESSAAELAGLMIGEDLVAQASEGAGSNAPAQIGDARLRVSDLVVPGRGGRPAVDGVTFDVHAGEIVGVAGVAGSGQRELLEALAGVRPAASGAVVLDGQSLADLDVARRRAAGIGYVPADRIDDGLVGGLSIAENLALLDPSHDGALGWLDRPRHRDAAARVVREHDVRPPDPDALAEALSGGNQQKVLVARELAAAPKVLLAAEPVRGLDFRATEAVHGWLRRVRDEGGGVLLVSTDLSELLAQADRILVLYGGRIAGEVDPRDTSEERIGLLMAGGRP